MQWTKLFGAGAISVQWFVFCVVRVECKPVIICLKKIFGGEHIYYVSFGWQFWNPHISILADTHRESEGELCSGRWWNHPILLEVFPVYICCTGHWRCNTTRSDFNLNLGMLLTVAPPLSSGHLLSSTFKPTVLPALVSHEQQKSQGKSVLSIHSICYHPFHVAPKSRWAWKDFSLPPEHIESVFSFARHVLMCRVEGLTCSRTEKPTAKLGTEADCRFVFLPHPNLPMSSNIPISASQ